jgi:hypothetical protein
LTAADIDDVTWCDGIDSRGEVEERSVTFGGETTVLGRIPSHQKSLTG